MAMSGVGDVAQQVARMIQESLPRLQAVGEDESGQPWTAEKWSRRQVLGHLIDSAFNNYHRVIRAQSGGELVFPDYEQAHWVSAGGYQARKWAALVGLWAQMNMQLAHAIAGIAEDRLDTTCRIGADGPQTLEFIVRDYPKHMQHHLRQILDPGAAEGKEWPSFAAGEKDQTA
jgi:hypothetical protein